MVFSVKPSVLVFLFWHSVFAGGAVAKTAVVVVGKHQTSQPPPFTARAIIRCSFSTVGSEVRTSGELSVPGVSNDLGPPDLSQPVSLNQTSPRKAPDSPDLRQKSHYSIPLRRFFGRDLSTETRGELPCPACFGRAVS